MQIGRISITCNVIELLQLMRNCEVQCQTHCNEDQTLIKAIKGIYNYKQGSSNNSEYCKVFKDHVATTDQLGAAMGEQQS